MTIAVTLFIFAVAVLSVTLILATVLITIALLVLALVLTTILSILALTMTLFILARTFTFALSILALTFTFALSILASLHQLLITLVVDRAEETTVRIDLAETLITLVAALGIAIATALTRIAAVMDWGMHIGFLLANDWQVSRAAGWGIHCTTWSNVTRAQHQACALILVTIPIINPALAIGTTALVGQSGGIQKVVYVNAGQMHAEALANLLSLATRYARIHHDQVVTYMGAEIH